MPSIGRDAAAPAGPRVVALTALGPAVEPIRAEAHAAGVDFVRRLFEEWASGANRFDRQGEICLGVWQDDRLVGLGGLNRDPYTTDGDIGRLRHVYVLGSHRHLGLGALLVRHLLREAAGHFRIVRLRAASTEAAAFYRRLGFSECADPAATHVIPVPISPSSSTTPRHARAVWPPAGENARCRAEPGIDQAAGHQSRPPIILLHSLPDAAP